MYKWFIVCRKSNTGMRLNQALARYSIVHYWPQIKGNGLMAVYKPLFPEYIFIYIDNIQALRKSTRFRNYFNIVYWLDAPAVLRNEEIVAIRNFLEQHENISLKKIDIHQPPVVHSTFIHVTEAEEKLSLPSLGFVLSGRRIHETQQNWKQDLRKLSFGYSA